LDFPIVYASGRDGWAVHSPKDTTPIKERTLAPLFNTVIEKVKPPTAKPKEPFCMLVTQLARS
jgi:GTP-binding protein